MKNKTLHLTSLFYWGGLIITSLLLSNVSAIAQQPLPNEEFTIGAKLGIKPYDLEKTFKSFIELGLNAIWWGAYPDTKQYLEIFNSNVLAENPAPSKFFS